MGFAAAPAWLSILFEPLSMFFLPGFVIDAVDTSSHYIRVPTVLQASLAVYASIFWLILEVRAHVRTPPRRRPRA
jgi:hypothetical protein